MSWRGAENWIFTGIWCQMFSPAPRGTHHPVYEEEPAGNHLKEQFLQLLSDPSYLQTCCDICMLWLLLPLLVRESPHRHAAAESRGLCKLLLLLLHTHTHSHATGTHQVMASLKRQPEKKDALLMRRRGPCSEKARRGLQSWENPAQHKQQRQKKHGRGEREEEGGKKKNMNRG